ncbi:hypothetical protein [Haloterrigena salinisoli]|uniref:hypothetical protein n=1 Tax=Haloterrigena salinisoli TaxID=3132747 RepID=UPI0030CCC29C
MVRENPDIVEKLLISVVLLFAPVIILVLTIGFLMLAGGLVLGELSVIELLELYILELILFTVGSYLLFRFREYLVKERLPKTVDKSDERRSDDSPDR